MSSGYEVVDEGHSGGDWRKIQSEWKTIRAVFNDFASLPAKRSSDSTVSPVLKCHGLDWRVLLFPGGNKKSNENEANISVSLRCFACTKVAFNIRIPSAGYVKGSAGALISFSAKSDTWGVHNYAKRADVLDTSKSFLVGGDLIVEVDIQIMIDPPVIWTPTKTSSAVGSDMLKMLESNDPDDFDITFKVGDDQIEAFHAHRNILKVRAPVLADFVADSPGSTTEIPIKDVEPDVFRMLLRFIYGGEMPSDDILSDQAKPIIHAADKYGCTGLKLAAEAKMAAAGITTDNAADLILFADATNCAMLKEVAMEYFVKNAQAVMASKGFEQVKESPAVMAELMALAFGGSTKRPGSSNGNDGRDYKRMRVATLRQKLDEKKLDVDGSKEMLVSRLEAADAEAEAAAQAAARAEAENNNDEDSEQNSEVED